MSTATNDVSRCRARVSISESEPGTDAGTGSAASRGRHRIASNETLEFEPRLDMERRDASGRPVTGDGDATENGASEP